MEDYSSWRLTTDGNIRYKLIEGPTFSYEDLKAISGEMVVVIRAQDVEAFMLEMLPPVTVTGGIAVVPDRYLMPGTDSMFCKSVDARPIDVGKPGDPMQADLTAPLHTYSQYYQCTLRFEPREYGATPETFLETEINFEQQFIKIPSAKTEISTGSASQDTNEQYQHGTSTKEPNLDKGEEIMLMVPVINISQRYKFVLSPNWPLILSLVGKVNSTVSPYFLNAEIQTVLFKGFSARREFQFKDRLNLIRPWNMEFQFAIKRIPFGGKIYGWNDIPYAKKASMAKVILWGSRPLYELGNLALLFS